MRIGSRVVFGSNVFVTDNYHGNTSNVDMNRMSSILTLPGEVVIEDGAWIGNNVCILPGVTIGRGSIVGANSVVNSDIPPYTIAAGAPAKVKKTLHPRADKD
jgi:acetyltransferase-like isoleucine patch superfamily enzyme